MYYAELINNKIVGFYLKEIHGIDKCNLILSNAGIKLDEELHQYLLNLGQSKFIGVKENKIYTLLDKALFEKVIPPVDNTPQEPAMGDRVAALEAALMGVL